MHSLRLEDQSVVTQQDLDLPLIYSAAPRDEVVLKELRKYETREIKNVQEHNEYADFLQRALKPLGLFSDTFLPGTSSSCYKVTFGGQTVAIFRLTPAHSDSDFHQAIPDARDKKILEVNNVAVEESFKGDLLLGIILRNCALLSHAKGFDIVAGVVRYEVLPLFTDFGTIPVRHDPMHLLGDTGIHDYVTYFMTDRKAHIDYALARSYHYFHRKVTMKRIRADVDRLSACSTNDDHGGEG